MPSLPNVLGSMGHTAWIPWVYVGMPIGAIISPFFLGVLSDSKVSANKLCGYVMLLSGVTMTLAFWMLHAGADIKVFVGLMLLNSLFSAPIWTLITQSALAYLTGKESQFPYYRLWGTIGWLVAGLIGGLCLNADESAFAGVVAGLVRFPAGICCFFMPECVPLAKGKKFSILQMLGEGSKALWKDQNTRTILVASGLIAIPLSSFFMYCPLQMTALGVQKPTAWLSIAQWVEVPAMLSLGWACTRIRMKWLMGLGLGVCVLRFGAFALSAHEWIFLPMALGFLTHGLTFTYFLTVAQIFMERRVASEFRGRAQGMLSLMFGGVGSLLGVILVGVFFDAIVDLESNTGWVQFWLVLAGICVVPTVYFFARYKKSEGIPYQVKRI